VNPEMAFGQVLRELRKEKNFSQEKLALEASLDRTFISLLERGLRQPSLSTILNLSTILGISASRIVEKVEERIACGSKRKRP
jgi:transcriptional regulator with XRE-family HTH domain